MKTLGSVESITGGLFASKIIAKPHSSKYFRGALVLYAQDLKQKLGIDVSKGTINDQVALEMAKIGAKILNVDICVSFTGNAGPKAIDNQPVGKVFIAINDQVFEKDFKGSRNTIRNQAVNFALKKINFLF